jgi:hypothetical protein
MNLEGDKSFHRALGQFEIEEVDGDLAIDLMDQMIALSYHGVFMPIGNVHVHRLTLGGQPAFSLWVNDHTLAILDDDTTSAFFIHHCTVRRVRMDIALVTSDGPFLIGIFAAAVLDAGVVAFLADFCLQLKVLHLPTTPDEKLIVSELLRPRGVADDFAVLDLPEFRIAIPASEIFAIENGFKPS